MAFDFTFRRLRWSDIRLRHVLAIAVVLALALTAILLDPFFAATDMSQLNLERDVCTYGSDHLGNITVAGPIALSPVMMERAPRTDNDSIYRAELEKLVAAHNANAKGTGYVLLTWAPSRMQTLRYSSLTAGLLCEEGAPETCRSRQFWFFRKLDPTFAARFVFEHTVKKETGLRRCRTRKYDR